ncbi:MAG TPA: hypothetical protein VKQ52_01375, partial [Puia sp.]|nr:hypothetical protein [Puia sp.]
QRRDCLCGLLDAHLKDKVSFRRPSGGMAVWACFARKYPLKTVAAEALRQGLFMYNGQQYNTHNTDYNALRLGFASLTEEELGEAMEILSGILSP